MSLISFKRKTPPYATMLGTSFNAGTSTTALFPFADTFISSEDITRNSATRVTVTYGGYYELLVPIEVRSLASVGTSTSVSIQVGINGVFTTLNTASADESNGHFGWFAIILELNDGDYVELKSLVNNAVSSHVVYCTNGLGTTNGVNEMPAVITMKRI